MLNRRLSIPVLVLLVLASFTSAAFASHSLGYHWARTSNPFTIKLGNDVNSSWLVYLVGASADWTGSIYLNTTVVSGGTNPALCNPTKGRVEVCNYIYGNTGWLGVATVWVNSSSHITKATVKLNDAYFLPGSSYDTPAWRRLVTCQEIGHTFGLDHQDESFYNDNLGTCMDYTADPEGPPSNEHPNLHDYVELATIYSHTDTTTTVGASVSRGALSAPPAMADAQLDGVDQWGKLVALSKDGGQAVFERDLGRGDKVVTFVTFIPDVARDLAGWAIREGHFRK